MDYQRLSAKKDKLSINISHIPDEALQSFERSFDIEYAHNSTAIEGNTLSLIQTKAVIEDGLSVGGKTLREIYEVVNHAKAFDYVKKCISKKESLSESIVKDIHALLMDNIIIGGIYRNVEVRILGAGFVPPVPEAMYNQIKQFYIDLMNPKNLNSIEFAAWTHAEFVRIHPFVEGNGRTSRMLMNYQLMAAGFLPVSISKEDRITYYDALEQYASNGDLNEFSEFIAHLEEIRLDEYLHILTSMTV